MIEMRFAAIAALLAGSCLVSSATPSYSFSDKPPQIQAREEAEAAARAQAVDPTKAPVVPPAATAPAAAAPAAPPQSTPPVFKDTQEAGANATAGATAPAAATPPAAAAATPAVEAPPDPCASSMGNFDAYTACQDMIQKIERMKKGSAARKEAYHPTPKPAPTPAAATGTDAAAGGEKKEGDGAAAAAQGTDKAAAAPTPATGTAATPASGESAQTPEKK